MSKINGTFLNALENIIRREFEFKSEFMGEEFTDKDVDEDLEKLAEEIYNHFRREI